VDNKDQPFRALKKLKLDYESGGFPITSTREIQILRMASHTNIVRLEDIIVEKTS